MAIEKYIKSKNNFVSGKKHVKLKDETIVERDSFSISNTGLSPKGRKRIYSDSNFKLSPINDLYVYTKTRYNNWLANNCPPDIVVENITDLNLQEKDEEKLYYVKSNDRFYDWDSTNEKFLVSKKNKVWSLECLTNCSNNSLSEIIIKPDNQNIQSFAYYGSSIELFKTTIINIIKTFPGEIFLPIGDEHKVLYYDNGGGESLIKYGDVILHRAMNPFDIDIKKTFITTLVDNDNRYFCKSIKNYVLLDGDGNEIDEDLIWAGVLDFNDKDCYENGELIYKIPLTDSVNLYYYYVDGSEVLLHDSNIEMHIRLNLNEIEKVFNGYNDWLINNLLNRYTTPKYTSRFKTINEGEDGYEYGEANFNWPLDYGGWNIDISNREYSFFIDKIQTILINYDKLYCDNLWRMLCHESIKNIDSSSITLTSNSNDSVVDGLDKLKTVLNLYGRQFDEIKMYIDNIKFAHTVTYDGLNNTPDYMLSDLLSIKGWLINDIKLYNGFGNDESLYDGWSYKYSDNDINILILKQLILCGNYIQHCKGTKKALNMIMALFGVDYSQYEVNEYVNVATSGYDNYDKIVKYNNRLNSGLNTITTDGLMCTESELVDDTGATTTYVIPWIPTDKKLNNSLYFQMKGGWGATQLKNINSDISENVDSIHQKMDYFNDDSREFKIYDETSKDLKYIDKITNLVNIPDDALYDNVTCYVENISNFMSVYNGYRDGYTPSHYFILRNISNKNILGSLGDENEYGWQVIYTEFLNGDVDVEDILDISGDTQNANRVIYHESILNSIDGNNPHIGFLKYDSGKEYLDNYRQLFKYNIDNSDLSFLTDTEKTELKNIGFTLTEYIDNKKSWCFYDKLSEKMPLYIKNNTGYTLDGETEVGSVSDYKITIDMNNYDVTQYLELKSGVTNIRTTELIPYNPELGSTNDDIASASIINNKKLIISSKDKTNKDFTNYLINKVIPFIKQIIPSTTLVEYDLQPLLVTNKNKIIITEQYASENLSVWAPSDIISITSINEMTDLVELSHSGDVYVYSIRKKNEIVGGNDILEILTKDGGAKSIEINYLYINAIES